jgi:hypothetical protein
MTLQGPLTLLLGESKVEAKMKQTYTIQTDVFDKKPVAPGAQPPAP